MSHRTTSTHRNGDYGRLAEQAAADWLTARGYIIRERNWSPRHGHVEVDVIAQRDNVIAFVEVKARSSGFLDPVEAVTPLKIRHLVRAANAYLLSLPDHEADALEARFDIMAVGGNTGSWNIEHIPDAFIPPLSAR